MTLDLMFRPTGSGSSSGFVWTPTSQTSNYNAAIGNLVLGDSSGGTFTVTLPASPGSSGGMIAVQKTDSSFTGITIDGNGNNINGSSTTTINTQYEEIILVWNGTSWFMERYIPETFVSWSAPTITGFGTTSNVSFFKRRNGDSLEAYGFFTAGTLSGTNSLTLPDSLAMDTSKVGVNNTSANPGQRVGWFSGTATDQFGNMVTAKATSTTIIYFGNNNANNNILTPGSGVVSNSANVSFYFLVPISGWK